MTRVGQGLGEDVRLGNVEVGWVPELVEEVVQNGVVGLTGVMFLDIV